MKSDFSITVVVDNSVHKQGLLAEHGLSLLIDCCGQRILFDTGQGMSLIHNLKMLDIPFLSIDTLVLSHSHYDHTGGVDNFLARASDGVKVFAHSGVFEPCFSKRDGTVRYIGMSDDVRAMLMSDKTQFSPVDQSIELNDSLTLLGDIPRLNTDEQSDCFYKDAQAEVVNDIDDELVLCYTMDKGMVVVLGCAHSGVVNTLEHIMKITGRTIYGVIGGMHLTHATSELVLSVADYLYEKQVELVVPMHCTGGDAVAILKSKLGTRVQEVHIGGKLTL